jgi:hypothetical protein
VKTFASSGKQRLNGEYIFDIDESLHRDPFRDDYTVDVVSHKYMNSKGEFRERKEVVLR